MEKLYALTDAKEPAKQNLYIRKKGGTLDFFTYFNSFSLGKWVQYTTLEKVALRLQVKGSFTIRWTVIDETGEHLLLEEKLDGPSYERNFPVSMAGNLLGFTLTPLTKESQYLGGAWYGEFSQWKNKTIGVSICTFKREPYVRRTMDVLQTFQKDHPWLSVLVVDNGSTLPEENRNNFRVVHNPNYGGSGGFTRGMLEYADAGKVDYVLLMDDDIVLDPTALERTRSLLCGLRDMYKDSFLSGAMLRMEQPTMQFENTAYWDKIVSKVLFQGLDLASKSNLDSNGILPQYPNAYGGWWYCCIPVRRIKEIGYPLPAFIKSDDMEYGIRNGKELLCLNGIGVWHESFAKKLNAVMRFYSDRNTFILNHYAYGCGRFTLLVSILARIAKRIATGEFSRLYVLEKALEEYRKGFAQLTAIPGDVYFQRMNEVLQHGSAGKALFKLPGEIIKVLLGYGRLHREYLDFREEKLKDGRFWKSYLKG